MKKLDAPSGIRPVLEFPVAATVNLIGGKYKSLILWSLREGTLRFSQLRKALPCATAKMLTQQLRELENDGLVERKVYPVIPPKVEYSLTDLGQTFCPVLKAMNEWGKEYLGKLAYNETSKNMS